MTSARVSRAQPSRVRGRSFFAERIRQDADDEVCIDIDEQKVSIHKCVLQTSRQLRQSIENLNRHFGAAIPDKPTVHGQDTIFGLGDVIVDLCDDVCRGERMLARRRIG